MGVRAVISSLFLKEPVTIQYRGNRKKITMTTRMATEKTLYPLEVPLRSVVFFMFSPLLNCQSSPL